MATRTQDRIDQLIEDLEQRRQNLKLFDGTDEINSHCDDLIGQVTLTVESAMDHLNKVQDRMINEINEYRRQLIDAQDSLRSNHAQSPAEKGLRNLSTKIEMIKSNKLPHDEALELAKNLLEKANDLRKKLRAETFGGNFLRLIETDFMKSDIIGKLEKSKKDVQDDFAIKHLALDDMVSSAQALDIRSGKKASSGLSDVTALLFLRDGNLAVGRDCEPISIWDPKANKQVHQLKIKNKGEDFVTALAELPSGHLVVGANEGSIEIWDIKAEKSLFAIGNTDEQILWLRALPDGKLIAFGRTIRVWDLSDLKKKPKSPETCFEVEENLQWFDMRHKIDASNTLRRKAKADYLSKEISLFYDEGDDFDYDPDLNLNLRVHVEMLWDGNLAYSYLLPSGPRVTVWDPNEDQVIEEVDFKAKDAESCVILPNGEVVICRANDKVEIYSLNDQKLQTSFTNDRGPIVAIRMQTKHSLTFVHLKNLNLPILADERVPAASYSRLLVTSSCFSDDGKRLALGSRHERVATWPIQN